MLELKTGVPGSGKTLSVVHQLAKTLKRWEEHPDEVRPVYVRGVKDLTLPHMELPLIPWEENRSSPAMLVPDWNSMIDGALVIIDEAQHYFPMRSPSAAAPPHVSFLNEHRHRGFDIILITQGPKLVDSKVRAVVAKHQHYRRLFGRKVSAVYEWDAVSDGLQFGSAVKSAFKFPRSSYNYYKSAEIHTKQSFRLPLWFFIPIIGIGLGIWAVPRAYAVLHSGMSGHGLSEVGSSPASHGAFESALARGGGSIGVASAVKASEGGSGPKAEAFKKMCYASVGNQFCRCRDMSGAVIPLEYGVCMRYAFYDGILPGVGN